MIASFLAAFMSTLDTHFNLASAYLVNDLYRRFLVRGARPRHYVNAGRVAELSVGVLAALLALSADSISDLFTLSLSLLGGLGPALLLRWFWWRANAWTEISALASSTLVTLGMRLLPHPPPYPLSYVWVIGISCLVMCFVTLATPPVPLPALRAFHARIRPAGWWGPCRSEGAPPTTTVPLLVGWVGGVALLYGLMLGAGTWLLGGASLPYWSTALVGGSLLRWSWRRAIA